MEQYNYPPVKYQKYIELMHYVPCKKNENILHYNLHVYPVPRITTATVMDGMSNGQRQESTIKRTISYD